MVVSVVEQLSGGEVVAPDVEMSEEVALDVDNPSGSAAGSKPAGVPGDEVALGARPSGDMPQDVYVVEKAAQEEDEVEGAAQVDKDVQAKLGL